MNTPTKRTMKDRTLQVRMSSDQYVEIQRAAGDDGLDISAWMRMVALRAAKAHLISVAPADRA